jgi:hypothetical protein
VNAAVAPRPGPKRRRWTRWLGGVALATVLVVGFESIPGAFGHDQAALSAQIVASDAARGASKIDPFGHDNSAEPCASLESTFGVGNHLFKNRQFGFYASVWPSYQALSALYVTSLFPGKSACSTAFGESLQAMDDNYWSPSSPGVLGAYDQGPRAFHFTSDLPRVDDSLWMGLAILQQYSRTRDPALLERAEAVFDLAQGNWARGLGGVYWEATGAINHARTVVSNAPAAILGVELFRLTGDARYLTWSEMDVAWLDAALRDPATGLFNDNIDADGHRTRLDTTKYTYTQGMMVGAMAVLSTVDPKNYPISDAIDLIERSLTYFDAHRSYGQPGFDLIWAENILWTAGLYQNAAFTTEAKNAVGRILTVEPKDRGDLLTASSETALQELAKLPPDQYDKLLYVIPDP